MPASASGLFVKLFGKGASERDVAGKFVIILRDELNRFLENQPPVAPSAAAWLVHGTGNCRNGNELLYSRWGVALLAAAEPGV